MDNPIQNSQFITLNMDKVPIIIYLNPYHFPVKKIPVKIVIEDESIRTDLKTDNNNEGSIDSEIASKSNQSLVLDSNVNLNMFQPVISNNNSF